MINWRDKMSIDDGGVIDQDHKHLIDIINRFEGLAADGLSRDDAAQILHALKFYTQTHFGREEQLQNLIDYPYAATHHDEHQALIGKLDDVIAHLNGCADGDLADVHREIAAMLHDWLVDHILTNDLRMRVYLDHMKKYAGNFGALKDLEISVE